jgi:5'-nucleotidase
MALQGGPEVGRRRFLTAAGVAITAAAVGTPAYASDDARDAATASEYVDVQLLNITDLHGFLDDAPGGDQYVYGNGENIRVGGVGCMATHLDQLRDGQRNSIFFAPGDNFSGWEYEAESMADECTVEVLNRMGLRFSSAGNHEFDKSPAFLIDHMEHGVPFGIPGWDDDFVDSAGRRFRGANFRYYSANMVWAETGQLVLPPYNIEWVDAGCGRRLPIGFIHLTVSGTETGSTSYNPALASLDEIETVNKYAAELKARGVNAIVVSMHDGAVAGSDFNAGVDPSGPAYTLAQQVSPDIAAIVTGHWHCRFNMMVPDPNGVPRPFVEAGCYSQLINEINLKLDPRTGEVIRELTVSTNHANSQDVPKDPEIQQIADYWTAAANKRSLIPIGRQTGSFSRTRNANGESTMGDLAADWALWSGRQPIPWIDNGNRYPDVPADLALVAMAPFTGSTVVGGDLPYPSGTPGQPDGTILFGQAWAKIGYGDPILTATITGASIHDALEQQWQTRNGSVQFAPLAVSANVSYSFDASAAVGDRVDPANVLIDGRPLDVSRSYRVATTAYTWIGADGYPAFGSYTEPVRHDRDFESFIAFIRALKVLTPSGLDRVSALNASATQASVGTVREAVASRSSVAGGAGSSRTEAALLAVDGSGPAVPC